MLSFSITVPVDDNTPILTLAENKLGGSIEQLTILKKSVDARKKDKICFVYNLAVKVKNQDRYVSKDISYYNKSVSTLENITIGKKANFRAVVVGSGPCGLFCALTLCYLGVKPIVIERGDDVDTRVKKREEFFLTQNLDFDSNVQFGEGGAGTFSDGKLNTGVNNEYVSAVIREFVNVGAPEEILYESKPHVGTDLLITVVKNLRKKIISLGGEFRFNTKLIDLETTGGKLTKVITNRGNIDVDRAYLCIGHSARDTIEMLYAKQVKMVSKTYSMGVRIEHLSNDISVAQYGKYAKYLPTADYKMAVSTPYGSLYTFCMCPGGEVINASSEKGMLCVNGMSNHARDGINSNSALLINVGQEDFASDHPLAGMEYQRKYERKAFLQSGKYLPIAQTVGNFAKNKQEGFSVVKPSVRSGYVVGDLRECLPKKVTSGLLCGIPLMGKRIKGFDSESAVLCGVETRSSSPIKILRDDKCCCSIDGLYPLGEGAGYAGGITSAGADGVRGVILSLD